MTVLTLRVLS
ncbi:MAG: hypothetical protein QG638_1561, partial [Pseudomonadota bacterium]|nr:hypothetical protein [Pseudomonadota bacterium]